MTQTQSKPNRSRALLWVGIAIVTLLVVAAVVTGVVMARMNNTPGDLDFSTTQSSENGLFKVSYAASTGKVPINQMHEWTLHVETADGTAVENAEILVDGDMPQHGHGLATRPRVTQYLGNGDYQVEGLRFQMAGWWVMDFTISANGQTDSVHFNMQLD